MMVVWLQGFTLTYTRTAALRTRKIIRNALINVVEAGRRGTTEWNVQVVHRNPADRRKPAPKRHRRVRMKVVYRRVVERS